MTWNHSKLLDDGKDAMQRLEDALLRGDLEAAEVQLHRLRALTRFLGDEIFESRMQRWDDSLTRAWDVETK